MKEINNKSFWPEYNVKVASAFGEANVKLHIRVNTATHDTAYVVTNYWDKKEFEFEFSEKGKEHAIAQYNEWIGKKPQVWYKTSGIVCYL